MALNPFRRKQKIRPELAKLLRKHFNITAGSEHNYRLALTHSSATKGGSSNERLEFLGDSILDAVVADLLYERHPTGKEGELTKLRSSIVSRQRLNKLGRVIGLMELLDKDDKQNLQNSSVSGNALEAIVGAIYLDKGFNRAKRAIRFFLEKHLSAEEFSSSVKDAKSLLLEWGQRHGAEVKFITSQCEENNKLFNAVVSVDGQQTGAGKGSSKKKAEKQAAAQALGLLVSD